MFKNELEGSLVKAVVEAYTRIGDILIEDYVSQAVGALRLATRIGEVRPELHDIVCELCEARTYLRNDMEFDFVVTMNYIEYLLNSLYDLDLREYKTMPVLVTDTVCEVKGVC